MSTEQKKRPLGSKIPLPTDADSTDWEGIGNAVSGPFQHTDEGKDASRKLADRVRAILDATSSTPRK